MPEPELCCDLVMKGGITSGVLYPPAIREIAQKHWLVGIGGTSAGAIASSLAAAAEFRRRETGSEDGFSHLEQVARQLAQPGELMGLFRPDRETRKLFELLRKFLEGRAGLLAKARLGRLLLFSRERSLGKVVDNLFGLCTGMANGNREESGPPLTEWLADLIDEIAGKADGLPLTFADLHGARSPEALTRLRGASAAGARSIDFRAVTTSLTFGRPLELPLEERIFAFREDQWRRLFPARIVDYIVDQARQIDSPTLARDGFLPLPLDRLPIVVAARMSLSFPLLFSMVPLHAVNFHKEDTPLEPVWLSDGGITSNFPIHRFDALYPRWPTMGLNLQYTRDDGVPQRRRLAREGTMIYLPSDRGGGVLDLWSAFAASESATSKIFGFAGAIFRSAQVWHDNSFLKLPGYRDRVAEIWLTPDEGGLNLDMDGATIERLLSRGQQAGELLTARFAEAADEEAMSWQGHRWTRFRSSMAGFFDGLLAFATSASPATPSGRALAELLGSSDAPPAYRFESDADRDRARRTVERLLALLEEVRSEKEEAPNPFAADRLPRPHVEVGTRPRI